MDGHYLSPEQAEKMARAVELLFNKYYLKNITEEDQADEASED